MGIKIFAKAVEATLVGNWVEQLLDDNERAVIGRSLECDMVLNDPSVELRHACFENTGKGWSVMRLGQGEVLINGMPIERDVRVPVNAGDELLVGVFAVGYFRLVQGAERESLNHKPVAPPDPVRWTATLVVLNGPCLDNTIAIGDGKPVVVGRGRDCDLVLDDKRVSRYHARITNTGGFFSLEDMGSSNGVYINTARIDGCRRLEPGDVIGFGRYRVMVRIQTKDRDDEDRAMMLAVQNQAKGSNTSLVGFLCLVLSVIACAAAYLI